MGHYGSVRFAHQRQSLQAVEKTTLMGLDEHQTAKPLSETRTHYGDAP